MMRLPMSFTALFAFRFSDVIIPHHMLDIVGIAVAGPAQALGHHGRELQGVQLGIAAVVGKGPGDVAAAEVVALEGQRDPAYILRAARF